MADARSGSSLDALWRSQFGSTGSGKPAKPAARLSGAMRAAGSTPPRVPEELWPWIAAGGRLNVTQVPLTWRLK
jgi:hypothetical protein